MLCVSRWPCSGALALLVVVLAFAPQPGCAIPYHHRHHRTLPAEDGPMHFAAVSTAQTAIAQPPQQAPSAPAPQLATTGAAVAPLDPPVVVSTRQHAFTSSRPHASSSNCHTAFMRPLSECPKLCHKRGVCGVGEGGDVEGTCACFDDWTGHDCSLKMTPDMVDDAALHVLTTQGQDESASSALDFPHVTVCYYTANASSFFDYSSFDMPTPLLSNVLALEQSVLVDKPVLNLLEQDEGADGDFTPPPPPTPFNETTAGLDTDTDSEGSEDTDEQAQDQRSREQDAQDSREDDDKLQDDDKDKGKGEDDEKEDEERVAVHVDMYGDVGTYTTATCAVWRRGGGGFHSLQGYSVQPKTDMFVGKELVMEVQGQIFCSDLTRTVDQLTGQGVAQVQWMVVYSEDGTNVNTRTLDQGEVVVRDGVCEGHGKFESLPVYGHVPAFARGAYVGVWMRAQFVDEEGVPRGDGDYITLCDDLKYRFYPGDDAPTNPASLSPLPPPVSSQCEDCDESDLPVIQLPLPPPPAQDNQ